MGGTGRGELGVEQGWDVVFGTGFVGGYLWGFFFGDFPFSLAVLPFLPSLLIVGGWFVRIGNEKCLSLNKPTNLAN